MQVLNYTIIRPLGEGGMGDVYLAKHNQIERFVAIKQLNPQLVKNQHLRERFKSEAATLAGLSHPAIVTLYDYAETPEGLFLIMEYVEGEALNEIITSQKDPLSEDFVLPYFIMILEGFAYAHSKGVVHRDIKPSNIMISNTNQVKILDFGIARLVDHENSKNLTRTGMKLGTLLYMSPEQIRGVPVDFRSDIYSLGVTLYQMLTGKEPYDFHTLSEYDITLKIVNDPLIDVHSESLGITPELRVILATALAKTPEHRYASCHDFKNAIETYLQTRKTPHKPAASAPKSEIDIELELPATTSVVSPPPPAVHTTPNQPTQPESAKPISPVTLILGVIAVVVVLLVSYFAFFQKITPAEDTVQNPTLVDSLANDSTSQLSDTTQAANAAPKTTQTPAPKPSQPANPNSSKSKQPAKDNRPTETTSKPESQTNTSPLNNASENSDIIVLRTLTWSVNNRKNFVGEYVSEFSVENTGSRKIKTAAFRFRYYNKQGKKVHQTETSIGIDLAPKTKKVVKQKHTSTPDVKSVEVELVGGSLE